MGGGTLLNSWVSGSGGFATYGGPHGTSRGRKPSAFLELNKWSGEYEAAAVRAQCSAADTWCDRARSHQSLRRRERSRLHIRVPARKTKSHVPPWRERDRRIRLRRDNRSPTRRARRPQGGYVPA